MPTDSTYNYEKAYKKYYKDNKDDKDDKNNKKDFYRDGNDSQVFKGSSQNNYPNNYPTTLPLSPAVPNM